MAIDKEKVIDALKKVEDPELHMDVWTLKLIYEVNIEDDNTVDILMTFTSPMCPYGPVLLDNVKSAVQTVEGVKEAKIEITFDPPWEPSEELREMFGI